MLVPPDGYLFFYFFVIVLNGIHEMWHFEVVIFVAIAYRLQVKDADLFFFFFFSFFVVVENLRHVYGNFSVW